MPQFSEQFTNRFIFHCGCLGGTGGGPGGSNGGNGNNNNNKKGRPLPTHDPERRNEFPNKNDSTRLGHIFREKQGHYTKNTPYVRKQLTQLVNNEKNYEGTDIHGKRWYSQTLRNGEQLWAFTQNNVLWDAGKNKAKETREFDPIRGMVPKKKPNQN